MCIRDRHTGGSVLKLPVIAANVTEFQGTLSVEGMSGPGMLYVFKRAVYVHLGEKWHRYPCTQVYPLDKDTIIYKTKNFDVIKKTAGSQVTVTAHGMAEFKLCASMPERKKFAAGRPWLHPHRHWYNKTSVRDIDFQDQWVAVSYTHLFCLIMLLVDIVYAFVDPRIRSQYAGSTRKRKAGKGDKKE